MNKVGQKTGRYCAEGHDKLAPHGSYEGGVCAICKRLREKKRYQAKLRGKWLNS